MPAPCKHVAAVTPTVVRFPRVNFLSRHAILLSPSAPCASRKPVSVNTGKGVCNLLPTSCWNIGLAEIVGSHWLGRRLIMQVIETVARFVARRVSNLSRSATTKPLRFRFFTPSRMWLRRRVLQPQGTLCVSLIQSSLGPVVHYL